MISWKVLLELQNMWQIWISPVLRQILKTIDAVVRNLEIIGEAAKNLKDEVRSSMPDIEWRKIIGLRNRIIHGYFGIDREIIWRIVHEDVILFDKSLNRSFDA